MHKSLPVFPIFYGLCFVTLSALYLMFDGNSKEEEEGGKGREKGQEE